MANAAAQQWAQAHLDHVPGEELRRSLICGWNGDEKDRKTRTNKLTKPEYGAHTWKALCAACKKLWGVESDRDGKANRDGFIADVRLKSRRYRSSAFCSFVTEICVCFVLWLCGRGPRQAAPPSSSSSSRSYYLGLGVLVEQRHHGRMQEQDAQRRLLDGEAPTAKLAGKLELYFPAAYGAQLPFGQGRPKVAGTEGNSPFIGVKFSIGTSRVQV